MIKKIQAKIDFEFSKFGSFYTVLTLTLFMIFNILILKHDSLTDICILIFYTTILIYIYFEFRVLRYIYVPNKMFNKSYQDIIDDLGIESQSFIKLRNKMKHPKFFFKFKKEIDKYIFELIYKCDNPDYKFQLRCYKLDLIDKMK